MADDNKTGGGDPVSFTDTNAETGMTGKGATSSNMMDLVGQLKKQREEEEKGKKGGEESAASSKKEKSGDGKKKKKKGKKGKKGKTKYVRRHDRYESENYLLRIEGVVCFSAIVSGIVFVVFNFIVLLTVIIWSGGSPSHLHNTRSLNNEKKD